MALDNRGAFIQEVVGDKSFLEVGGLWGEVNEKATVAHLAGAREVAALDIWPRESEWWEKFRNRCGALGLTQVKEFVGSIDNPSMINVIGTHDVVHCAGVLYHCPNPYLTISNLRHITGDILLLTAAVMPPVIENEDGRVEFDADSAILVPALTPNKRKVVDRYIRESYGGVAFGVNDPIDCWFFQDGSPNYGPWWWLWSAEYLERMVSACGLEIVKTAAQYGGTGHLMMLRKTELSTANYGIY